MPFTASPGVCVVHVHARGLSSCPSNRAKHAAWHQQDGAMMATASHNAPAAHVAKTQLVCPAQHIQSPLLLLCMCDATPTMCPGSVPASPMLSAVDSQDNLALTKAGALSRTETQEGQH